MIFTMWKFISNLVNLEIICTRYRDTFPYKLFEYPLAFAIRDWSSVATSVTRLGDLLDLGQLSKAFGNN